MLSNVFRLFAYAALDDQEALVVVRSADTGEALAATYDVTADVDEFGDLKIFASI